MEEMEEFLSEKPKKTYSPFLLPDMEAGVDLILSEIRSGARICIYGDYDADGITSTALMLSVLGHLISKDKLDYYIPSRFEEGYGLNKEAIKNIADKGFNLLITVDCGSVSFEEVKYAEKLGMKVVVTDHHNITDAMADCPLINPKHPRSQYPFKELSGCGVAFKVAQALQQKCNLPKSILTEVLDLVAIGTIGDIMPLVNENRTMVKYGLKVINEGRRIGLKKLIEGTSLRLGEISSENISYIIVPHLNASGRIEDASQAVELLYGNCPDERLDDIVADVIEKNTRRKNLQMETFQDCIQYIDKENPEDFVIINSQVAHEGIAGIVAGKIKETYYRPTILLTPWGEDKSYLKGTGRSVEGLNLYEILKTQESLFEKFGGHAGACGFLMRKENFENLRKGLLEEMRKILCQSDDLFQKKYIVELELDPEEMTLDLAEQLEMLAPFGNKNRRPLVRCSHVLIEDKKYMGEKEQHVRFSVARQVGIDKGKSNNKVPCILFNRAQDIDFPQEGYPATVIGTLGCNRWQGISKVQLMTEEIEID